MVKPTLAVPPVLCATTVYTVADVTVEGVPEIMPLVAFNPSPVGSVGLTVYEATGPPVDVGTIGDIAVPVVKLYDVGLYEIIGAATVVEHAGHKGFGSTLALRVVLLILVLHPVGAKAVLGSNQ